MIIHNKEKNKYFNPNILDDMQIDWQISGSPSRLRCKFIDDEESRCNNGDVIQVMWNSTPLFYGFIFTITPSKDKVVEILAYDQLRYLKNKDSLVYKGKTATELTKMIANRFNLKVGSMADTGFVIDKRIESNTTLLDMIQFALSTTLVHTKNLFILFDDFGKLRIESPKNMEVPILIDEEMAQDFKYSRSIDKGTYNLIKLVVEDKQNGTHKEYYAPADVNTYAKSKTKAQWGILQKFEVLNQNTQSPQDRANKMLELYNVVKRKLTLENVKGDIRVRAGSMLYVSLNVNDLNMIAQKMIVTAVSHKFSNNEHTMNVELKGGIIND